MTNQPVSVLTINEQQEVFGSVVNPEEAGQSNLPSQPVSYMREDGRGITPPHSFLGKSRPRQVVESSHSPRVISEGSTGAISYSSAPESVPTFVDFYSGLESAISSVGSEITDYQIGVDENGNVYVKNISVKPTRSDVENEASARVKAYNYATGRYRPFSNYGQKATIFDYMVGYKQWALNPYPSMTPRAIYTQSLYSSYAGNTYLELYFKPRKRDKYGNHNRYYRSRKRYGRR